MLDRLETREVQNELISQSELLLLTIDYERHHPPVYGIIRYFKKKGREGGGIKLEIYTKGLKIYSDI